MQHIKLLIDLDVWLSSDATEDLVNALADRANDAIARDHHVRITLVKMVTSYPAAPLSTSRRQS